MVNGCTSGAMRQLVRIFQDGTLSGLSDREVLGRFVDDRDEAAYEVLLGRHGPMVLNVCRQVLRDPDDAEDAFQATFLALACKASTLRVGESLGPWLYRVANRVAARARANRRRRADREPSGGAIPEPAFDDDPDRVDLPTVVHEELDRLPERLRAPIVLCYLEGNDARAGRAAAPLPGGTVRSRYGPRRALLHGRISKRGSSLHRVARRRPGIERVRIGRHDAYLEFPGQGRDAARRRHRLAPRRVRPVGARRRSYWKES